MAATRSFLTRGEGRRAFTLGCGKGEPKPALADVRWQTGTAGVNQDPVP